MDKDPAKLMNELMSDQELADANREWLLRFDAEQAKNRVEAEARYHSLAAMRELSNYLDGKGFMRVNKPDLERFFDDLEEIFGDEDPHKYGAGVKRFFQWFNGFEGDEYPDIVDWYHPPGEEKKAKGFIEWIKEKLSRSDQNENSGPFFEPMH